jgi:glyoxylase-like metal-dependent hydrolase (beta-lactamase superfamily II)
MQSAFSITMFPVIRLAIKMADKISHRIGFNRLLLLILFAGIQPSLAQQDDPLAPGPSPYGRSPHTVTEVASGVYSFSHSGARSMFIITDEGVIVTDPMHSYAAEALREEIANRTDQPVKYVIYSHNHWDHILGGKLFKDEGAQFISHKNCLAHFYGDPHPDLILPDVVFDRHYQVELGNRKLELQYFGRNHDDCTITMFLPDERLLFIVDLAMPGAVSLAGGWMRSYYPKDWIRSLQEIEDTLAFDRYMPGHGPAVAPKSAMTEVRGYLEALMEAVRTELAAGTPGMEVNEKISLPDYQHLRGYDEFLSNNADRMRVFFATGY